MVNIIKLMSLLKIVFSLLKRNNDKLKIGLKLKTIIKIIICKTKDFKN